MSKRRLSVEDRINKATPIASAISAFTSHVTDSDTHIVTKNDSENVIESDKNSGTNFVTNDVTKNVTSFDKDNNTNISYTKSIKIGNSVFKSIYKNTDEEKRAAYHLRQDTIDKIEKCSKLSGLKKHEFVDLILNNVLTDLLNKIDK